MISETKAAPQKKPNPKRRPHRYNKPIDGLPVTNPGGAPPRYKTPGQMQEVIDRYFESLRGPLLDKDGYAVFDDKGLPVMVERIPPAITDLALFLGFSGRMALLNYQHKDDKFNDTVSRAKARIEGYAERRLYDKEGFQGARFNLINNFKGWQDTGADIELRGFTVNLNVIPAGVSPPLVE